MCAFVKFYYLTSSSFYNVFAINYTCWATSLTIWYGKIAFFDIDVVGGLDIKNIYPEKTLAVFVKPPSIEELKIRLKKRKTETDEKISMRVANASIELATAPQFDFIIENHHLGTALKEAYDLVASYVGVKNEDKDE